MYAKTHKLLQYPWWSKNLPRIQAMLHSRYILATLTDELPPAEEFICDLFKPRIPEMRNQKSPIRKTILKIVASIEKRAKGDKQNENRSGS